MRIKINVDVNLATDQVEAFEKLVGPATEKELSQYILANGIIGMERLVHQVDFAECVNGVEAIR